MDQKAKDRLRRFEQLNAGLEEFCTVCLTLMGFPKSTPAPALIRSKDGANYGVGGQVCGKCASEEGFVNEKQQPRGSTGKTRDTFHVLLKFDDQPNLSPTLEMSHLPRVDDRLLMCFYGNMVAEISTPRGFYEVVESVQGNRPEERYSGSIRLRRLSSEEFPDEIGEDCYMVSLK